MSSTNATLPQHGSSPARPVVRGRGPWSQSGLRRLPVAGLGLLGAVILAYGVTMPWVSTFAGLISQSGQGTRNGNILLAGAAVSAILAAIQLVTASTGLRWLLALTGFATAAFGGYLLIQLYTATQTADAMALVAKGPGLYVASAGAALVFATIFLPMPTAATGREIGSEPRTTLLPVALGSWLRYPAAVLAVVAGLAHVPVTPEHLNEAPYIGVSFLLLTVVCVVLAAALLISDSALVWATLGGSCLLAVVAYVVSRTVGLPLMADDIGNWFETLGVISIVTEAGVGILAAAALTRHLPTARA